jgi:hypothetical protein
MAAQSSSSYNVLHNINNSAMALLGSMRYKNGSRHDAFNPPQGAASPTPQNNIYIFLKFL